MAVTAEQRDWVRAGSVSLYSLIITHVIRLMAARLIGFSFRDRTRRVNQITHYFPQKVKDKERHEAFSITFTRTLKIYK